MNINSDYIKINRENWNERTGIHVGSDFYNVQDFVRGQSSLNDIELKLLGNIERKEVLHLQCHFGMDSISLQRLGADITAVDFSDAALENARQLNSLCNTSVKFIECDVLKLDLRKSFDIIFSSYGVIGWLPDMKQWATVISKHLKPGGKFVFVEFHPVVWMFDPHFREVMYSYFNVEEIVESETGTYADRTSTNKFKSVTWNHNLAEVMKSLIDSGLIISGFEEYDYSPYNCFADTEEFSPGKFRIKHLENKIPMLYSIVVTKSSKK